MHKHSLIILILLALGWFANWCVALVAVLGSRTDGEPSHLEFAYYKRTAEVLEWSRLHSSEQFVLDMRPARPSASLMSDQDAHRFISAALQSDSSHLFTKVNVHKNICLLYDSTSLAFDAATLAPGPTLHSMHHFLDAGWPFRAFRCTSITTFIWTKTGSTFSSGPWAGALATIGQEEELVTPIPLAGPPIPMAANTAFYASILAACWYGPGVIRRTIRRRAGKCLACGYARAGLPRNQPCPECGQTVDTPVMQTQTD